MIPPLQFQSKKRPTQDNSGPVNKKQRINTNTVNADGIFGQMIKNMVDPNDNLEKITPCKHKNDVKIIS